MLMSCRRGPSDFSRQNRRQLCTVNSRGNCNCSERLTSLPNPCLHTVRKKRVRNDTETKLVLVPLLTWCHYGQHSSVCEVSWQYDYLIWAVTDSILGLNLKRPLLYGVSWKLTGTTEIKLYSHLTESTNIMLQNASHKYFYTCHRCTLEITSPEHLFRQM